ncbi:MAG: cobalt transporter [Candidatus Faecivicinus sp.]
MGHEHHDHEYMHEHNIPHSHENEHCHEHDHDHDHEHPHCHGDCAKCGGDPRAELVAMMKYMVNHNTAHANELAGLARQLKELGDNTAYEQVMAAVSDFEKGNMRLSAVLAAMNIPQ